MAVLVKGYSFAVLVVLSVYGLIYLFSGDFELGAVNHYNPFSRQAESWLNGRLDLPENVTHLEIAEFGGRYFVSFPPFPTFVVLPFVAVLGTDTPDHAIALVVSLLALLYAYKLALRILENSRHAVFMSLFLVIGTNYLHIALWGAVWYLAQNIAFLLTLMAFYYGLTDNRKHSVLALFFMCAAMGTRPFNAVYLPILLYLIYIRESKEETEIVQLVRRAFIYAIPAILLGVFFMWLNYMRFGSIFEFGHNYLEEFLMDEHGQFYVGRILGNLRIMFLGFNLTDFPLFHGFAFWIASPIFLTFAVYFVMWVKNWQYEGNEWIFALPIFIAIHIIAFSMHTSLGGHQFGSRYTVDILPIAYLGVLFMAKSIRPNLYLNTAPMVFGLLLNFIGTIEFLRFYF